MQADIILVQDTGETTRTAFMETVEAARRLGFSYFAKSIIPEENVGYNTAELTKLRELALKESETKYYGFGIFVRTGMSEFVSIIPSGLPDTRYQHMTVRNQAGNLHIFNVYLPTFESSVRGQAEYEERLSHLRGKIQEVYENGETFIAAGDWNATLDPEVDRIPPNPNRNTNEFELQDTLGDTGWIDIAADDSQHSNQTRERTNRGSTCFSQCRNG